MTPSQPPIAEPLAQRIDRLRRGAVPVVVWTVLALVALVALSNRSRYVQYTGLAQSLECPVAPVATGRLHAIVVSLNDRVDAGQALAVMDGAQVDAMIATAHANVRKLRADLAAASASMPADAGRVATDLLRLQMDEDARRLDVLSLNAAVSGDAVEIERRRLETGRLAELARTGLTPRSTYDDARLALEELQTRNEQTRVLLAQTDAEWRAARDRRERYERTLPVGRGAQLLLAPLREAIAVEEARLAEIEVQRASLVLRSPVAGQVSQIWSAAGQVVRPGDPVVTIVESSVRSIVFYDDTEPAPGVRPRTRALVTRRTVPPSAAESAVVSVGESVQQQPSRLWRDPRVPAYGRAVVLAPVPSLPLAPGELVDVKLLDPR